MTIFKYADYSSKCIEFVDSLQGLVGDITSFEVFNEAPDHYCTEDQEYKLILKNDEYQMWIDGLNCGYGGEGPRSTISVLQMLGIQMDYEQIYRKQSLEMTDLKPVHKIHVSVFNSNDYFGLNSNKVTELLFQFPQSSDRWGFQKALSAFGSVLALKHSTSQDEYEIIKARLDHPYIDQEHVDYSSCQGLFLNSVFNSFDSGVVHSIIHNLARNYNGREID